MFNSCGPQLCGEIRKKNYVNPMFFLVCEFSDFWYVLFFFVVSFKYGSFFLEN